MGSHTMRTCGSQICRLGSATEVGDEPEEERESDANEEASDDGKVKGGVFAAVDDVPRKSSEAEGEFASEIEKSADKNQEAAEEEKRTAEFAERVHRSSLLEMVH